jgi:hypothetical protein
MAHVPQDYGLGEGLGLADIVKLRDKSRNVLLNNYKTALKETGKARQMEHPQAKFSLYTTLVHSETGKQLPLPPGSGQLLK